MFMFREKWEDSLSSQAEIEEDITEEAKKILSFVGIHQGVSCLQAEHHHHSIKSCWNLTNGADLTKCKQIEWRILRFLIWFVYRLYSRHFHLFKSVNEC